VGTINFCFLVKKLLTSCNNEKRHSLDLKYPRLCLGLLQNEKKIKSFDCNHFDESSLNNGANPKVHIFASKAHTKFTYTKSIKIQSNLISKTKIGLPKLWPLLAGGRCSEVPLNMEIGTSK
jgi:hypothetical protein